MVKHECQRCGEANPDDASYCATCGLPLSEPGGVAALAALDATDDEPQPTSEWVEAPTFGETGAPVIPSSPIDDLPPTAPPAAGVATTALPANTGPPPAVTAVAAPGIERRLVRLLSDPGVRARGRPV